MKENDSEEKASDMKRKRVQDANRARYLPSLT